MNDQYAIARQKPQKVVRLVRLDVRRWLVLGVVVAATRHVMGRVEHQSARTAYILKRRLWANF
jgi:hypothetical protein